MKFVRYVGTENALLDKTKIYQVKTRTLSGKYILCGGTEKFDKNEFVDVPTHEVCAMNRPVIGKTFLCSGCENKQSVAYSSKPVLDFYRLSGNQYAVFTEDTVYIARILSERKNCPDC